MAKKSTKKERKLAEFGEPGKCSWQQQNISDLHGELETLCDREVDRVGRTRASLFGTGRLARRYDLVDKAKDLLEEAMKI